MAFENLADAMFDVAWQSAGSEVFTIGSLSNVQGIRAQLIEKDALRGNLRKTLITVRKAALTTWPDKGAKVSGATAILSLVQVVAGDVESQVILECTSTPRNPS
jgi:hypothetical protein